MSRITDILIADMRHLLGDLGKGGGLISPSIYDTAQVIRLAPASEHTELAIDWLLGQQQPDGGWGTPATPMARDLPTLATILALSPHATRQVIREALEEGLEFLGRQMGQWAGPLPDDIPVGVELLLPHLLHEAVDLGLDLPLAPYADLIALGERRRRMIAQFTLRPGTTPSHSWEALNLPPTLEILDGSGGVGHSPAATAAWLRAVAGQASFAPAAAHARDYLSAAAAATNSGIPSVYPTVWPIDRFEQDFGLYALLLAGLLEHPGLRDLVERQISSLAAGLRPNGLGMSDHFMVDGDITATALAVLISAGRRDNADLMDRFEQDDHYFTYPGELQPSLSTTAHAVHALSLAGTVPQRPVHYLLGYQAPDGRWMGDKWHGSWLYTTCHIGIALANAGVGLPLDRAAAALCAHQHPDGGWGMTRPTAEETAHGVLLLRTLQLQKRLDPYACQALERGERWLFNHYRPFGEREADSWIGKEMYIPRRVSRMIELAALLTSDASDILTMPKSREAVYVLR